MKHLTTAVAISLLSLAPLSNAATINFDDLPAGEQAISDGYMGFNWGHGSGDIYAGDLSGGSYPVATVSESNVAFGGWDTGQYQIDLATAGTFTFSSAYFTSAWEASQDITFTGLLNGSVVYSATSFSINNTAPTLITLDWSGIDSLSITNVTAGNDNKHWAMDDMTYTISAVPEPSTYALMLGGFGLVGFMAARRQKQRA